MRFVSGRAFLAGVAVLAAVAGVRPTFGGDVIAEISVRNRVRPSTFHGEVFMFPGDVRDYSPRNFYGWSFRHEQPSGASRILEVARARTAGAYLFATDLFANGLFSTMSHTVLMVFPRSPVGRRYLYALREDNRGNLELLAPDGSTILVDGASGAVLPTATFAMAPLGATGTPPGLRHEGLHLEIHSVGKSPFLRNTRVRISDRFGASCRLATDELFVFGKGAESDVFRFETDPPFFRFLEDRCPEIRLPVGWQTAAVTVISPDTPAAAMPAATVESTPVRSRAKSWWHGGLFDSIARSFSKR